MAGWLSIARTRWKRPVQSKPSWTLLAGVSLAAFGGGYLYAPKDPIDKQVEHRGLFSTTTSQVLSVTVESLRKENKLLVYSYKGTARVKAVTDGILFFNGEQELLIPAVVNYYLDLSKLTLDQVEFDERVKVVKVKLPKLELGDIAFQPEQATTINGGLLTFSAKQIEALNKVNYRSARRAMIAQAQGKGFVDEAKQQARTNIASYFEIPLRIAGQPDVKVVATFPD